MRSAAADGLLEWRGWTGNSSDEPENSVELAIPSRAKAASTLAWSQPAKQWKRMAFRPSETPSEGVLSSCAGQRAMPLVPDHFPPRFSQILRAVSSSEVRARVEFVTDILAPSSLNSPYSPPLSSGLSTIALSYMFYLCSISSRSKRSESSMRPRLIPFLCCGLAIATPGIAQAQEFRLFRHSLGASQQAVGETEEGLPPEYLHRPSAEPAPLDRTFKEALYEPLIRQAEARYSLPPRLLQAVVWQESRFNPLAISPAGAAGLAQLMPATARELGVANRHDPAQNIDGGARYLRQMLDRFGAIHLALAAYNAGPGAVSRARGIPKNRETPGYVRSVIERWMAYSVQ